VVQVAVQKVTAVTETLNNQVDLEIQVLTVSVIQVAVHQDSNQVVAEVPAVAVLVQTVVLVEHTQSQVHL
jgi:hypothetical protein